jgi:hypothetical protein
MRLLKKPRAPVAAALLIGILSASLCNVSRAETSATTLDAVNGGELNVERVVAEADCVVSTHFLMSLAALN